jgi:hypothetical protein
MVQTTDELHERLRRLERQVKRGERITTGLGVLLGVLALGAFYRGQEKQRFAEIDVERINVVETDGRPALIIANTQRLPGPMWRGRELSKTLSQGRVGSAGLMFINAQGTEVGGLAYRTAVTDSSYSAHGILTFDQHNQDQVVGLHYFDRGTSRSQGLSVWDRPTHITIGEIAQLLEARGRATTASARDTAQRRIDELARGGGFGAHRVFVGSEDRTAGVRIKDTAGRERIRILVDSANVPRLEFLDEQGRVIHTIPERRALSPAYRQTPTGEWRYGG